MVLRIEKARLHIGGLCDRAFTLAPLTAIVGPEEAGKTSFLTGVRAALRGELPVKMAAKVMQYVPDGSVSVACSVDLSDKSTSTFEVAIVNGKISEQRCIDPRTDLVADESWSKILDHGSTLGQEALFRRFGPEGKVEPFGLMTRLLPLWRETLGAASIITTETGAIEGVDQLGAAVEALRLAKLRVRAADLIKARDRLGEKLGTQGLEELPELQRQLAEAEAHTIAVREADAFASIAKEVDRMRTEVKELTGRKKRYTAGTAKRILESAPATVQRGKHEAERLRDRRTTARTLLNALAKRPDACPCCATSLPPVALSATMARLEKADAKLTALLRAEDQAHEALRKRVDAVEMSESVESIDIEIAAIQRSIDHLAKQEPPKVPTYSGLPIEDLLPRIDRLRNARTIAADYAIAVEEVEVAEARTRDLKWLHTLAVRLQRTQEEAVRAAALSAVNRYLRDGRFAALSSDYRWGYVDRSGVERYEMLSGSMRSALLLTLPLAWGKDDVPPIVLLDDDDFKGFSAAGVKETLAALSNAQRSGAIAQVIVTRHLDRANEIPDCYTMIELDPTSSKQAKGVA